jgi:ATP-dependent DNA helicase RecQ
MVRPLLYPANSFEDLGFLLPVDKQKPLPKFLIFFDNIKIAEAATKHLHTYLPQPLEEKIQYFHATMTLHYREEWLVAFQDDKVWGLCITDAFGMVNLIKIIIKDFAESSHC